MILQKEHQEMRLELLKESLKEKSTYQGSRYHIFGLFYFFGHKYVFRTIQENIP